jgi:pentatricopeptide repeat protein
MLTYGCLEEIIDIQNEIQNDNMQLNLSSEIQSPTSTVFNKPLSLFFVKNSFRYEKGQWKDKQSKIVPNAITYTILLKIYVADGQLGKAFEIFEKAKQRDRETGLEYNQGEEGRNVFLSGIFVVLSQSNSTAKYDNIKHENQTSHSNITLQSLQVSATPPVRSALETRSRTTILPQKMRL